MTVIAAVGEIHDQAEGQPDEETHPGPFIERGHKGEADDDSQNWNERYEGRSVRSRMLWMSAAQDHDAAADDDEGEKSSDAGHVAQAGERHEAGEQADEDHKQKIRAPGGAELRVDVAEHFR